MQPRSKIEKSSWMLHESVKDSISQEIMNGVKSGQLKIESASIEKLLMIIGASADAGYHKAIRAFGKTVETSLNEAEENGRFEAEMPSLKKSDTP